MFNYTIQAMPGQKSKSEGDTSIKYQVRRVDTSLSVKDKGRSVIIRTNLEYDAALELIKGFNDVEKKSQTAREEAAQKKSV